MGLSGRDLVEMGDLDDDEVRSILARAKALRGADGRPTPTRTLEGGIVATLFFEASTRTRLSFESAAHRLGATTLGFADAGATSQSKGETLEDTVRIASAYADAIVLRHPEHGSALRAAAAASIPVINAGDGAGEHPTQALLDLFTIGAERGSMGDNHVVLLGDLRHGRTVHSLAPLLARFGNRLSFVAPDGLAMPPEVTERCLAAGATPRQTTDPKQVLADADVLYVTRVQKERFPDAAAYAAARGSYIVDDAFLAAAPDDITILHPLPRLDEIPSGTDARPNAAYFRQAANGVLVRMALLEAILGP